METASSGLEWCWDNSLTKRDVKNVCEDISEFRCTVSQYTPRNVFRTRSFACIDPAEGSPHAVREQRHHLFTGRRWSLLRSGAVLCLKVSEEGVQQGDIAITGSRWGLVVRNGLYYRQISVTNVIFVLTTKNLKSHTELEQRGAVWIFNKSFKLHQPIQLKGQIQKTQINKLLIIPILGYPAEKNPIGTFTEILMFSIKILLGTITLYQ